MTLISTLRPAQAEILGYTGGPLAISAVPGAGKTFILTQLVARLVGDPALAVRPHQILVLTYMRGAAMTFKRRAAAVLGERGLTAYGLQCMTIHAFCLAVVRQARALGGEGDDTDLVVFQDFDQARIMARALEEYLQDPAALADFGARWGAGGDERRDPRQLCIEAARKAISVARNFGLTPDAVDGALGGQPELAYLYRAYEAQRLAEHALDFDALVAEAIRLLQTDVALRTSYQRRYRFVFEDEAQDSTPAQDVLIRLLTDPVHGGSGNLVRVGDSNQAIMTSFTFNDPRYFRGFCLGAADRGGRHVPMQESSRSAAPILDVANALAASARQHPDPAVQQAFVGEPIQEATAGKRNPLPEGAPSWTVYRTKDDEALGILARARAYLQDHPDRRAAILVFSNNQAKDLEARARTLGLPLYAGARQAGETKPILTLLARALAFLALPAGDPMGPFLGVLDARMKAQGDQWDDARAVRRVLKAGVDLEALIYPPAGLPPARPQGLTEGDYAAIVFGAQALRALLEARHLPPAELLPAIAAELLDQPEAPMVAARAAALAQPLVARNVDPLEALRAVLQELADQTTDRREILAQPAEVVEPEPGQLEILTLHRAKGAEYDAVWLPGLGCYYRNKTFFPWDLEQAEIWDQAAFLAEQALREHAEPSGLAMDERTRAAQCLTVAERLRLLYVGVTRAMRQLHLSSYNMDGNDPALPHVQAMIAQCERRSP
ncbi:MAG: helicase, UvrD/REP family [Cyanobacteria bacterium RYN_339]|nr:helicase, UvrD/REP family [Cyanobacteria bacterium RYN_339]